MQVINLNSENNKSLTLVLSGKGLLRKRRSRKLIEEKYGEDVIIISTKQNKSLIEVEVMPNAGNSHFINEFCTPT